MEKKVPERTENNENKTGEKKENKNYANKGIHLENIFILTHAHMHTHTADITHVSLANQT